MKQPPIGIDLGTTEMRVAVYYGSHWRMIPHDHYNSSMPIYVAFTNSMLLFGEEARKQVLDNKTNTIFDVTRLIGRQYSDPSVQNGMRLWPFQVKADPDDSLLVEVRWKSKLWQFTPVEILSMVLMQMKENAQKNLGATITDAVITVPIHFNNKQQQAVKKAGMIAGLNFMQIISAPAASALFYGIESQKSKSPRTIKDKVLSFKSLLGDPEYNMIIYHVGAETLDVVVATIKEHMCQVRATEGNVPLNILDLNSTNIHNFVKICTDMCLEKAMMKADMVHKVILFARDFINVPLLRSYINQYFNCKKLNLGVSEQLEETTAYGAAIQAFFCSVNDDKRGHCLSLHDVTPFPLGIQCTITDDNIRDSSEKLQEAFRYKENAKDKLLTTYKEPEEYAIGIDFGTTYSSVAVWQRNCVRVIENESGSRLNYSAVAFTDTGRLIGDKVQREQATTNPANTIPNIKRLIGRCYDQSIQKDSEFLPFKIQCDDKIRPMISVQYKNEEKLFAPEEIAAMILSKMKEIVEAHLTKVVTKAVVSVPACFSDSQRQAIKDAGDIADLNVLQLLNEPTAAAIAYFLQNVSDQISSRQKTLLIFDLGGGNLDVSIVTINEDSIRILAVDGDTKLGGEEFDNNMMHHFVEKIMKEKKRDISENTTSLRRLRAACEKAKRVLSTIAETVVEIDALDKGIDFYSVITREVFEELNKSLFERSIICVKRCLKDAKMKKSGIDEVVLVGGSTRIPKMQQVLQEFFNGKELCQSMNPDEAVVYGAAVQAAILSSNEDVLCEKFNISELQNATSPSREEINGSLSREEIKEMKEAADRYKKHDEENKAKAVALNSLENFAYEVKAKARDPSVSDSNKKVLEAASEEVIGWLDDDHPAGIDEINNMKMKLETTKDKVFN